MKRRKNWVMLLAVVLLLAAAFVSGLLIGASRGPGYGFARSVADKLRVAFGSPEDQSRPACVLVGDSLIARGDWQALRTAGLSVTNLGRGGARSEHLSQLFEPEQHQVAPAHVLIWIGANDILGESSIEDGIAKIKAFSGRCLDRGSEVHLLSVPPFGQASASLQTACVEFNRRLEALAASEGYGYVDTAKAIGITQGGLTWGDSFDGIHLSHRAARRVATVVAMSLVKDEP